MVITGRGARGGLAALLAAAVALSACSVSDTPADERSDKAKGNGSDTTEADAPDFSGAPRQGVTDDTITIGVASLDTQAIKDTYGVDIGNIPKGAMPALAKALNEQGGINGRKVELKVRYFMPIGNEPSEKVCRELVEDEKVFAVLGTFLADNSLCVTETYSIPYIGLWGLNTERHHRSKAPFVTVAAEEEEGLGASIDELVDEGAFKGKKVGVYYEPGTTKDAIEEQVSAKLRDAGAEVVGTGQLQSTNDAVIAGQDIDRMLERFRSDGADTMLFASGLGVVLPALERTSWKPQLVFAGNGQILGTGSVTRYGNTDPKELVGAIGAVKGLTSAEKADDKDMAECFATVSKYSDLKVTPDDVYDADERPGSKEMALLGETCRLWQFAVKVLTAAGDDPSAQSLLDGLDDLDDFDLMFAPHLSLSPTRWGAETGSRLWRFDEKSVTFVPADDA